MGTLTLPTTGTLSGLSLVNDTNAIVAILAAAQQGASAPTTATTGLTSTAGVLWHDTGTATVKLRNQADTAWITLFTINETAGSSSASINSVNGYPIAGARNRIINGNFAVNQRTYVSGTALAAGIYGHDRWKGGAGGGTYTFTAALPDTTITITAGTLTQVIEAGAMEGGTYTLSWSGTATARVNGGSYGASPLTVTAITAGVTCTVEFGTGTVGLVQFEPGAVATPWERRRLNEQFADCQRFYQTGQG
ncbi:MAG: hypothetical protein KGL35_31755, partial [Bradyrhizobium sp.]|nr:hypothetical protein [Bradyrhizobium sp.]